MPVALALSPHLDDAAFSCGGTLATLSTAGWRVVIATVFTASVPDPQGFALACQTDKGLAPDLDYMALRRTEDATAAAALGAEPVWLPFREAPHRGYDSAVALFGEPLAGDRIVEEVAPALDQLVDEHRPGLLLAPQAIGGHVDHLQIVRALDSLRLGLPILWWRDFPYVVRDAERQPFRQRMDASPATRIPLSPDAMAARRAGCHAYASQLGFQFGGPSALDAKLAGMGDVERFRLTGRANVLAGIIEREPVPA